MGGESEITRGLPGERLGSVLVEGAGRDSGWLAPAGAGCWEQYEMDIVFRRS